MRGGLDLTEENVERSSAPLENTRHHRSGPATGASLMRLAPNVDSDASRWFKSELASWADPCSAEEPRVYEALQRRCQPAFLTRSAINLEPSFGMTAPQ